jgi:nucleotide-binding universal stress UspA family protein
MPENEIIKEDVLIGLDGSRPSKSAAKCAVQIAQNLNLSIHGIFIIDESIIMGHYDYYKTELGIAETPTSQAELVQWFEIYGEREIHWLEHLCHIAHVPVSASLLFGGVSENIVRNASQAKLLVLGRRGNSHSDDDGHLGQYFQSMASRVRIPVLIGGNNHRFIEHILLAYDGSAAAKSALKWAVKFQHAMHCPVCVVAVNETSKPTSDWLRKIETELKTEGLEISELIARQADPVRAILNIVDDSHPDLILMGKNRHPRFLQWLVGSKVNKILQNTQRPIWLA